MLTTRIAWTLMFRVGTGDKAKNELERADELLGQKLQLIKCERYWKIPELWTCDASTVFEASSADMQIARCLLFANRLAHGWYVLGPDLGPDDVLENFEGIFDCRQHPAKLQSIEWAQFQII